MSLLTRTDRQLVFHPVAFARAVLTNFSANQGLMLAGAVAYYALLSLVPTIILSVLVLSHWIEPRELIGAMRLYLEWLVPSQAAAVLTDVAHFFEQGASFGLVLTGTMLFFSSLTFSILQKAMAQIFAHRHATQRRHALVAMLLPYSLVIVVGAMLLVLTVVSVAIRTVSGESISLFGHTWALGGVAGPALYGFGLLAEVAVLTFFYTVLPVGRTRLRHALLGAVVITALWDAIRRTLVWYIATLSKASVVYGSLTTAVVVLFSFELAATLLLLGAQVIAEYEKLEERVGR
jgi:YihY family inner membrane protein